jgi:phytoene synthase
MTDAGIDPEAWLAAPVFNDRIASLTARLLQEADRLYARGECGIADLPRSCRPAIHAARLVYADIGHALAAAGLDSVSQRTVVGCGRKLALLMRSLSAWWVAPGHPMAAGSASPALPAVQFLVDAAASSERPRRTFYQRTVRVIDMLERQAQRQRAGLAGNA